MATGMYAFPSDLDMAEMYLLYKLGKCLKGGTFKDLAQRPFFQLTYLDAMDLNIAAEFGARWSPIERHNSIRRVLGNYLKDIEKAGLELVLENNVLCFKHVD